MKIEAHSLVKRYGDHTALAEVTFSVPAKAGCLVLLGASGSGKSTLLRVLGSLLPADHGELRLDDQKLSREEDDILCQRRRNGFVFQSYNLFPHLTALENVALPLRAVHLLPPDEARHRAVEALERFGLGPHIDKRPAEMSGGQQQRVALVRAIAPKPQLLLLDEPTSALDPMMTQEVLDLIRSLAEERQQIVLSTHEITFARKVADWVVFLDQGRVVESGPAQSFFEQPSSAMAQRFLETLSRYR